jgi:2-dehydropantoate 2-reductase
MTKMTDNMKNIMILGAGAIGSYFATQFDQCAEFTTALIAEGERAKRLKDAGLVVNGQRCHFSVVDPIKPRITADLIIVALKHHQLADALPVLDKLVAEGTIILSMMNGLDSEGMIAEIYGWDKVLYGLSVGIDALRQGNRINFTKPGRHYFGEVQNNNISKRVKRVQAAFDCTGIQYEIPADMLQVMWWKFMVNVGMNAPSAVMRAPYGVFQRSADAQALMEAAMREALELAWLEGINLDEKDIEEWYGFLSSLSPNGKTSMLQDIEAGRKTEMEIFGGKVVHLAEKHGIQVPMNLVLTQIIHVLELDVQSSDA